MLGGVTRRHGALHWIVGLVPAHLELESRDALSFTSALSLCLLDAFALLFAIAECKLLTQYLKAKGKSETRSGH